MAIKKRSSFARQYRLRPLRTRASHARDPQQGWHWFDHPEMQARIAEAEAEMAAGLGYRGSSVEELMAYLDSLK